MSKKTTERDELREFLDKLLSHEGKCDFAERVATGQVKISDLEKRIPKKISPLLYMHLDDIEILSRNPCAWCGTFKLEKDHVGSGCCSAKCYGLRTKEREETCHVLQTRQPCTFFLGGRRDLEMGDKFLWDGKRVCFDGEDWLLLQRSEQEEIRKAVKKKQFVRPSMDKPPPTRQNPLRLRCRTKVHLGPPFDENLVPGDEVLWDGKFASRTGKEWKATPLGFSHAVKMGWFDQVEKPGVEVEEEDWNGMMERLLGA